MNAVVISLLGLAAVVALMTAVWVASLSRADVSLVDRFWGAGFVVAALVYHAAAGFPPHGWVVVGLTALWGVRLSLYLTWRNWGHGEDRRYRAMRDEVGPGFARRSLVTVFGLQAVILWVVSAPLHYTTVYGTPAGLLEPEALLAIAIFLFGWLYESVADWQMARFKADPDNRGQVCDRGLWRFSRHPNYFGEIVLWWGLGLLAASVGGWWTLFAPALMTALLVRVSGVPLLEQDLKANRPGYADYVARTNALVPGPKRSSS